MIQDQPASKRWAHLKFDWHFINDFNEVWIGISLDIIVVPMFILDGSSMIAQY